MTKHILDNIDNELSILKETATNIQTAPNTNSGLLPEEEKIIDHLVQAFTIFQSLPVQRKHDLPDFVNALHTLQKIISHRQMRRLYPNYWISEK